MFVIRRKFQVVVHIKEIKISEHLIGKKKDFRGQSCVT